MFYCIYFLLPIVGLFTINLMAIEFEKLKKNPIDRPILVKQGQVMGNKNIFKVGLREYILQSFDELECWKVNELSIFISCQNAHAR